MSITDTRWYRGEGMIVKNVTKDGSYVIVEIRNHRIYSINWGDRLEGRQVWHKTWSSASTRVASIQSIIKHGWDNVYNEVRKLCPADKLPPIKMAEGRP